MTDLERLVADLGKAPRDAFKQADATLKKAAHQIAEDIRDQVKGSETLGQSARSVSYDSKASIGTLRYEVGFDKMRKGGALGNIWEFGVMSRAGAFGGGKGDMLGALEREMPAVEKHLGDALGGLL
ncbi:hypothetical protein [Timonella senegalensis]|uniref:hypothetical protein n=1 Tax=Timonella senegalensis TaxID=1465825 RepID=UPI002FDE6527